MKKTLFACLSAGLLVVSCSKSGGEDNNSSTPSYLNTKTGSTWNYENIDNTNPSAPADEYVLTSTSRDTTVSGKTYHIYSDDAGASVYQGKSGNDYSAFEALPDELGGSLVDNIYLKAAVATNSSWEQSYPLSVSGIPVTAKITQRIVEKGLAKTVNGHAYSSVIHVKTDIALTGLPAGLVTFSTDIHSYYAPDYGMIQRDARIDYTVTGSPTETSNTTTRLKTATLL
ncbi:MAG: hypothetical protein QM687_07745 [Ferruginibacter sp.]